jgi:hypothetical protein
MKMRKKLGMPVEPEPKKMGKLSSKKKFGKMVTKKGKKTPKYKTTVNPMKEEVMKVAAKRHSPLMY